MMKFNEMNDQDLAAAFFEICEKVVFAKGGADGTQMKAAADEIHARLNEAGGGSYKHSDLLYAGLTATAWFIQLGINSHEHGELNNTQSLAIAETVVGLKEQFNSHMAAKSLDQEHGTKAYVSEAFEFYRDVTLPAVMKRRFN